MSSINAKLEDTKSLNSIHKPEFFRLSSPNERRQFEILTERKDIHIYDEINNQLRELLKSQSPKRRLTDDEYTELINEKLAGRPIEEYGVWVYYPWSMRLVHLLDEQEFIDLRTAANRHKITTAERDLLATKKVGVIGLSVGQSVSVTLALERGCGELRLADFDTLELNNLNRIRTGVHNLGLYKAYAVAREIAEIDPFFKVICYTEGITDSTIDDFFTKEGNLDLVIDECDGINIKIKCRIKAKSLGIPVLMEASDRGTLDVERFDLEPSRLIMHGWLKHLPIDFDVLDNLKTPDEKIAYLVPISGLETLSARMRASLIEIQQSITTWPQLASAVTLGGAITADTCRRIFLNQFTDSGRYFIDMESLVRDIRPRKDYDPGETGQVLDEHEMQRIAKNAIVLLPEVRLKLGDDEVRKMTSVAIAAPSAGNSQPWKWFYFDGYLFLFIEDEEHSPYGDLNDISSLLAAGAALENLELEARRKKYGVSIKLKPLSNEAKLAAVIWFDSEPLAAPALAGGDDLVNYIDYRVTNRKPGSGKKISKEKMDKLRAAVASVSGTQLIVKEQPAAIAEVAMLAGVANRIKLLYPPSHFEFFRQIRWNNDECMRTGDGVHIDSYSLSPGEVIAYRAIKKQEVIRLLSDWKGGQALELGTRATVASSSAIGLISITENSPENYILAGRAMQRMWLTASKNDLAIQPMQAAISQFTHLNSSSLKGMPIYLKEELREQYAKFNELFSELSDSNPVFLFRISFSEKVEMKTVRRQTEKVFFLPNIRK